MNQEILDKFLAEMLDMIKAAKDFSLEQLPLIAKEVLAYNTALAICGILLSLVFAVLSYKLAVLGCKYNKENPYGDAEIPCWIFSGLFGLAAIPLLCVNVTQLLEITLAPRLYLIETITKLVHR